LVVRALTVKNPARDVMTLSSFAGGTVLLKSPTIFACGGGRSADSAGDRDGAIKTKITLRHRQNLDARAGQRLLQSPELSPKARRTRRRAL
jgi:hypothetical protein